jgi:hypothetical protein
VYISSQARLKRTQGGLSWDLSHGLWLDSSQVGFQVMKGGGYGIVVDIILGILGGVWAAGSSGC